MSDQDDKKIGVYVVPGALFGLLAGYMLVTGELPVDKHRTMIVTRASDPLIYWLWGDLRDPFERISSSMS